MRIFFYSSVFAPSVGGIETLVETLCRQFVSLGHEVVLATETKGEKEVPFEVVRNPSFPRMLKLLSWSDVHVQANLSLRKAWVWSIAAHKTIYQHNNVYQQDDGTKRILDRVKTAFARFTPGIANSRYTAERTAAEYTIFNAYDDALFRNLADAESRDTDLVFLGRLVSQKGGDTLLEALSAMSGSGVTPTLSIIGDGPDRELLEGLAKEHGIATQVRFTGALSGQALVNELNRHRILIVPSKYEEPFGIVALEGLACGLVPIVSERGGLIDAIGQHGLTFKNGDVGELASKIRLLLSDEAVRTQHLRGVEKHLLQFRARTVAEQYLNAFRSIFDV